MKNLLLIFVIFVSFASYASDEGEQINEVINIRGYEVNATYPRRTRNLEVLIDDVIEIFEQKKWGDFRAYTPKSDPMADKELIQLISSFIPKGKYKTVEDLNKITSIKITKINSVFLEPGASNLILSGVVYIEDSDTEVEFVIQSFYIDNDGHITLQMGVG